MKIYIFANRKGGCGKTSLVCLLALYWGANKGLRVAVRDMDTQKSSETFVGLIDNPNIVLFNGEENHDILLVDTPGGVQAEELGELVELADVVIIPMSLSPTDIRSSAETARSIHTLDKTRLLFNRVNKRTTAFKEKGNIATAIGVRPLNAYLSHRIDYSNALVDGWKTLNPQCIEELEALAMEIEK